MWCQHSGDAFSSSKPRYVLENKIQGSLVWSLSSHAVFPLQNMTAIFLPMQPSSNIHGNEAPVQSTNAQAWRNGNQSMEHCWPLRCHVVCKKRYTQKGWQCIWMLKLESYSLKCSKDIPMPFLHHLTYAILIDKINQKLHLRNISLLSHVSLESIYLYQAIDLTSNF